METIHTLQERQASSPVKTSSLAKFMGVSPASVSEMLSRLSEKGIVDYTPYGGVSLTEKGWRQVIKLTRRHRLWEVFLNRHLGIGWEEVYEEACELEHNTSDTVAEKLAQFLDYPETCPHGSPIPGTGRRQKNVKGTPLNELLVKKKARILQVANENNKKLLLYLTELGLTPGSRIEVMQKASFDGTLMLKVNDSIKAVGKEAASYIIVEPLN
jgi:DtxR family Mn-dependent transcriptional regulator